MITPLSEKVFVFRAIYKCGYRTYGKSTLAKKITKIYEKNRYQILGDLLNHARKTLFSEGPIILLFKNGENENTSLDVTKTLLAEKAPTNLSYSTPNLPRLDQTDRYAVVDGTIVVIPWSNVIAYHEIGKNKTHFKFPI